MTKHIQLDEKLAALQEADSIRRWHSLDERRVCVLCNRAISGRMINVWKDGRGAYHLSCPTPSCPASPRDWFYDRQLARRRPRASNFEWASREFAMMGIAPR